MLSGFNTNFRYRGVLFHVQTEDSGLDHPHVITHLFHGGNIMASEKCDYSDVRAEKDGDALAEAIRKLMEGLHTSMLKQLSRGEHDAAIKQRMGPDVFRAASEASSTRPPAVREEGCPPAVAAEPTPLGTTVSPRAEPTRIEAESLPPENKGGASRLSRVFGDRVVSEKPLDEVVLDYLVENARKRKRSTKS